jgi:nudix-type nucleoside diphosphatase (YffH/AdpP family)
MAQSRKAEVHGVSRKFDGFFKIDEIDVSHQARDGAMRRERRLVFERGDAIAVLLYDAATDEVIVVEQFRAPVLVARRREDAHTTDGWIIEALAGMIDAGETPERAAVRETLEESGYKICDPVPIGTFFTSPGGTSERIFLYFAEIRIADKAGAGGGIAGEEDIALVRLRADDLFRQLECNQIRDAKLAIAAYWLKDRLARRPSPAASRRF